MKFPFFLVNAFNDLSFTGNQAGVCFLDDWLSTDELQNIATQTHLPETSFIFRGGDDNWSIRWFSPIMEVDLSGHGAIATAHVLFEEGYHMGNEEIRFTTAGGVIEAKKQSNNNLRISLDSQESRSCIATPLLIEGLGAYPDETYIGMDCLCVFSDESIVANLQPESRILKRIGSARGFIATAISSDPEVDFVTRFFAPRYGVNEDIVTGSIHNILVPYWARVLDRKQMTVKQLSKCETTFAVGLSGSCVWFEARSETFLRGEMTV